MHVNENQVFEAEVERKITEFVQGWDEVGLELLVNDILLGRNIQNTITSTDTDGDGDGDGDNDGDDVDDVDDDDDVNVNDSENENSNRKFDPSLVPLIVGISKDLTVCKKNNCAAGMTSNNSEEWYIHLAFPQPDHAKQVQVQADGDGDGDGDGISPAPRYNRRVQVPLVLFCELLQQKFKIQFQEMENLSSNPPNLCFIADASSSMASHLLSEVLVKTKLLERKVPCGNLEVDDDDDDDDANDDDNDDDNNSSYSTIHALVQEPAWMCVLALLLRKKYITSSQAESILYALVHLEACRFTESHTTHNIIGKQGQAQVQVQGQGVEKSKKVVVVTLPGQGCTMSLLPLTVKLFPNQRHVFAYSGYIPAVERGMMAISDARQKKSKKSKQDTRPMPMPVTAMPRSVSATMPIVPVSARRCKNLAQCLSNLPSNIAGIVEAWISSVDTLVALKEVNKKNGYAPFVCNIDHLLVRSKVGGAESSSEESTHDLKRVLEYIMDEGIGTDVEGEGLLSLQLIDAAQSIVDDSSSSLSVPTAIKLDSRILASIEDCVSCHEMHLARKMASLGKEGR